MELAFAKGIDDARRRVAKQYPSINLCFLDIEDGEDGEKGAPTTRAEGTAGPSTTA